MRPPDGTPDVENLSIVVFPPLPSNLALPQTRKCSDTDDRLDEMLTDLGSISLDVCWTGELMTRCQWSR
jgi:hypothetical protein